jgi:hypothetical protein
MRTSVEISLTKSGNGYFSTALPLILLAFNCGYLWVAVYHFGFVALEALLKHHIFCKQRGALSDSKFLFPIQQCKPFHLSRPRSTQYPNIFATSTR